MISEIQSGTRLVRKYYQRYDQGTNDTYDTLYPSYNSFHVKYVKQKKKANHVKSLSDKKTGIRYKFFEIKHNFEILCI